MAAAAVVLRPHHYLDPSSAGGPGGAASDECFVVSQSMHTSDSCGMFSAFWCGVCWLCGTLICNDVSVAVCSSAAAAQNCGSEQHPWSKSLLPPLFAGLTSCCCCWISTMLNGTASCRSMCWPTTNRCVHEQIAELSDILICLSRMHCCQQAQQATWVFV